MENGTELYIVGNNKRGKKVIATLMKPRENIQPAEYQAR
jgi:hypothetical protein